MKNRIAILAILAAAAISLVVYGQALIVIGSVNIATINPVPSSPADADYTVAYSGFVQREATNTAILVTRTITLSNAVPANTRLVMSTRWTQNNGLGVSNVVDTGGNKWTVDGFMNTGTSQNTAILSSFITNALAIGDTISVTVHTNTATSSAFSYALFTITNANTVVTRKTVTGWINNMSAPGGVPYSNFTAFANQQGCADYTAGNWTTDSPLSVVGIQNAHTNSPSAGLINPVGSFSAQCNAVSMWAAYGNVPPGKAFLSDAFNRKVLTSPVFYDPMHGGTWTDGPGSLDGCLLSYYGVQSAGSTTAGLRVLTPTLSSDQTASITLHTTGGRTNVGVMVRMASTSDASGYLLYANTTTQLLRYRRTDAGDLTTLGTYAVSALVDGDVLTLAVNGSTLESFKNGVSLGTVTDSTYATGQPGLYFSSTTQVVSMFNARDI